MSLKDLVIIDRPMEVAMSRLIRITVVVQDEFWVDDDEYETMRNGSLDDRRKVIEDLSDFITGSEVMEIKQVDLVDSDSD